MLHALDTPMTWRSYVEMRLLGTLAGIVLAFLAVVVGLVVAWWRDTRQGSERKPGEPYAGKTLGL